MNSLPRFALYFLVLVYFCGTLGILINPSFFLPFTPYSLVFTTLVFLIHQNSAKSTAFFLGFSGVALFGFFVEYLGLKTGWIFGNYWYGEALGIKRAGVPLSISLNWALLLSSGLLTVNEKIPNRLLASVLTALIVTGLDLIMEQVAPQLDYWYFKDGWAGLHNYLGWFLVSFSGAYLFHHSLIKGNSRIAKYLLLLQFLFFGTIFIYKLLISQ